MYTYIIESQGYHKIGRAKNVLTRMKNYDTHNPLYTILKIYEGDYEEWLHVQFRKKHVKLEWYKLSEEDIEQLPTMQMPVAISIEDVIEQCSPKAYTNKQLSELTRKWEAQKIIKDRLKKQIQEMLNSNREAHPHGGRNGIVKSMWTDQEKNARNKELRIKRKEKVRK
jgi:hypothetical protein